MKKDTVLICGSRKATIDKYPFLVASLDTFWDEFEFNRVVSGLARGYDTMAEFYANYKGLKFEGYKADWDKYGKRAGPVRNRWMFENERHRLIGAVIFPGGNGTNDMASVLFAQQEEYGYFIWDLRKYDDTIAQQIEKAKSATT